jgi:hypothetical protein
MAGQGTKREAHPIPQQMMLQAVLREPAYRDVGESEREAIGLLLAYFLERVQQAEHTSPLQRWWVGGAQQGKLGVYGRRRL